MEFAFGHGHMLREPGDYAVITLVWSSYPLFFTSEKESFSPAVRGLRGRAASAGGPQTSRRQRVVIPPTGPSHERTHRATGTPPPEDAEAVGARALARLETKAYVHQRIAEGDPFAKSRAVAHAVGQAPVDGRRMSSR